MVTGTNQVWERFQSQLPSTAGPAGLQFGAVLYLHGLSQPSGKQYVVAMNLIEHSATELKFVAYAIPTESFWKSSVPLPHYEFVQSVATANLPIITNPLRLFGGTADTADGMTFTIPYEINGAAGQIKFKFTEDAAQYPRLNAKPIESGPLK